MKSTTGEILARLLKKVKPRQITIEEIHARKAEQEALGREKRDFKTLLEAVADHPFEPSTEIYKKAGLSLAKGNRIKARASEKGMVKEQHISLGVRGGKRVYLEVTDKGYELLDELCVGYQKPKGKGAFEHRLYQHLVTKHYQAKGCAAEIEACDYPDDARDGDFWKSVDVGVVESDGRRIAIEVEMGITEHIVVNVEKDIAVGYERVVIVTTKGLKNRIEKMLKDKLSSELMDKIEVKVIAEFI